MERQGDDNYDTYSSWFLNHVCTPPGMYTGTKTSHSPLLAKRNTAKPSAFSLDLSLSNRPGT